MKLENNKGHLKLWSDGGITSSSVKFYQDFTKISI